MFISVIYDLDYADSDIISVPDYISDRIQDLGQMFCNWLGNSNIPEEYFVYINGKKCVNCETDGFVRWLNTHILQEGEQASIVVQHVLYNECYPRVDF